MKRRRTDALGATAILAAALVACSAGEVYPNAATGGTTGGTQTNSTGGTTGGTQTTSTGGATGGTVFATGGVGANTGGTPSTSTGGTPSTSSGGTPSTSSGGASGAGTGGGGFTGTSGSGSKGGTGGSGGSTGAVAFSQIVVFIRTNCGSCHANAELPNLNTQNPTALYTALTTVTVRQCGGNKLVTANDPSKSALLMVGTDKCTGLKMPAGCEETLCFDPADVTLLTTWIQQGAKNP